MVSLVLLCYMMSNHPNKPPPYYLTDKNGFLILPRLRTFNDIANSMFEHCKRLNPSQIARLNIACGTDGGRSGLCVLKAKTSTFCISPHRMHKQAKPTSVFLYVCAVQLIERVLLQSPKPKVQTGHINGVKLYVCEIIQFGTPCVRIPNSLRKGAS